MKFLRDRLATTGAAAFIGGLIGFVLALTFRSLHRQSMGGVSTFDFLEWIQNGAIFFGFIGLIFGPSAGTFVGLVINTLFESERNNYTFWRSWPSWWVLFIVAGVVAALLWL